MKKSSNFVASLAMLGVLITVLSGCSSSATNGSKPSASPTPTSASACSVDDLGGYGDVVPVEDVTDEYGTYCHVAINPDAEALKYASTKVNSESLEQYGFTEEDAQKAQDITVRFAAEEVIDSTILDVRSSEARAEWNSRNTLLFSPEWEGVNYGELVYNNSLPVLVRDGKPRIANATITVEEIYAKENVSIAGEGILVIRTSSFVEYRLTDEAAIEFHMSEGYAGTRESLIAEHGDLADGVENTLTVNLVYVFGFNLAGEISGVAHDYVPAPTTLNNN